MLFIGLSSHLITILFPQTFQNKKIVIKLPHTWAVKKNIYVNSSEKYMSISSEKSSLEEQHKYNKNNTFYASKIIIIISIILCKNKLPVKKKPTPGQISRESLIYYFYFALIKYEKTTSKESFSSKESGSVS